MACGCGSSTCGCSDVTLPVGPRGYNGWNPILAVVTDSVNLDVNGDSRRVHQIVGWTGGSGTTPTVYLNYYIGATGPVASIASAVNIRGEEGTGYTLTSTENISLPVLNGAFGPKTVSLTAVQSAYKVGARVRWSDAGNPTTNYFEGVITTYTGTAMTITVDFSTDVVANNIVAWNINLAGEPAAGLGFDDVAWVETTSVTPATDVIAQASLPTLNVTNIDVTTVRYRYKKLGRTLILSATIIGNQDIGNGLYNVAYLVKLPAGLLCAGTIATNGFCNGSVDNSAIPTSTNYASVAVTWIADNQYIRIGNFSGTATGANTNLAFAFYLSIVLETTV